MNDTEEYICPFCKGYVFKYLMKGLEYKRCSECGRTFR